MCKVSSFIRTNQILSRDFLQSESTAVCKTKRYRERHSHFRGKIHLIIYGEIITATTAPRQSAIKSPNSMPRPKPMSHCSTSITPPKRPTQHAIAASIVRRKPAKHRPREWPPRLRRDKTMSNIHAKASPPNIRACTTLSTPGNNGTSASGRGCGANVSQRIAKTTTHENNPTGQRRIYLYRISKIQNILSLIFFQN